MRIGVNTRFLIKDKLEGLGRYTHEVVSRLVLNHPEHEFVFFFDRPFDDSFVYAKNVKPVKVNPPARHPYLWYVWFEWMLPRVIKKEKIDYFFSPDSFLSTRVKIPQHVVIHDLAFEHVKDGVPGLVEKFYKKNIPTYCKITQRISSVSEFTKQDINKQYGIPLDKIDVAYNGASVNFVPVSNGKKEIVKKQYSDSQDYFVFVGGMHPRKNISNLLRAFDEFKNKTHSKMKLVLVGRKAWQTSEMEDVFLNMKSNEDVIFTGHLNDEELGKVVGAAHAMTYVPFFEGFGLPILEAQQCNVPVICSNTSSMPEVGGDAALLVDPNKVNEIAEAMTKLLDSNIHAELTSKCSTNAKRFSWDQTAKQVWDSIEKGIQSASI